ncbi:dienelactone hydrolase-like enzyme [Aphelenchoides avenae]|nr:dienelactone hydrolase-like enzyme [Aphelenchus avenae]
MPNTEDTTLSLKSVEVKALLTIPDNARGVVIFAHGSGSGTIQVNPHPVKCPRNQQMAAVLNEAGFATILMDLLTQKEDEVDRYTREFRFNIPMLAKRMVEATDWVRQQSDIGHMPVGYFGASTGAAAALIAAAERDDVQAAVSRGGRPDLAGKWLPDVRSATILLVGGHDYDVIEMNKSAYAQLTCTKKLEIVPGATHLFEEPGTLEQVIRIATKWFEEYMK